MIDEKEDFCFEATPYRIDGFGNHLLFGYPIVGGWLPTLYFKTIIDYDAVFNPTSKVVVKILKFEWFTVAYIYVYSVKEYKMFGGGDL